MSRFICNIFLYCFLLGSSAADAQAPEYGKPYCQRSLGGLCSSCIVLFKDSSFCMEHGCEASSYFAFGKWRRQGKQLLFTADTINSFPVINRIDTASRGGDSMLTVVFYDKNGRNITRRMTAGQAKKSSGVYLFEPDSTGLQLRGKHRPGCNKIVLVTLQRLLHQPLELPIGSSNIFRVYLNIPGEWNFNASSLRYNIRSFKLLQQRDSLVSGEPDIYENGQMLQTVYKIQQQ